MGMVALIVGGIVLGSRSSVEYVAPETVTEVVTEEVDALNKAVEDAIKASSTEITNAAQAAYDDTIEQMHRKIELEVRKEYRERLEGEIEALEKVTGEY